MARLPAALRRLHACLRGWRGMRSAMIGSGVSRERLGAAITGLEAGLIQMSKRRREWLTCAGLALRQGMQRRL
jgi:hypothetical protein